MHASMQASLTCTSGDLVLLGDGWMSGSLRRCVLWWKTIDSIKTSSSQLERHPLASDPSNAVPIHASSIISGSADCRTGAAVGVFRDRRSGRGKIFLVRWSFQPPDMIFTELEVGFWCCSGSCDFRFPWFCYSSFVGADIGGQKARCIQTSRDVVCKGGR